MRIISLALAFGIAMTLTGGVASAQQQFDGSWSIEVIAESGSCDRAYRFPVVIENGEVRYGGPGRVNVSGAVTSAGDIRGSVRRGSARAPGQALEAFAAQGSGGRRRMAEFLPCQADEFRDLNRLSGSGPRAN